MSRIVNVCEMETASIGATFHVDNAELYVSVVNDNIKFLETLQQRFKRIISWDKCKSKIATQPKNNNLVYVFDPTFGDINRLLISKHKTKKKDVKNLLKYQKSDDYTTGNLLDYWHH